MHGGASAYYDRIARTYDAEIATAQNHAVRECFWRCAESAVQAPSRILDFGAGTGIDAQHYAELGCFVAAYDDSQGMLDVLRQRCAPQIEKGSIVAVGGPLDEASPVLAELAPFDAVLSNFAVLSTVRDLDPVLGLFSKLLRKGGLLLTSIQNPWDPEHFRTGAFWKALLKSGLSGTLRYPSLELGTVYHRTPGQIVRAASRNFVTTSRARRAVDAHCFGRGSHFRLVELTRR